MSRSAILEVFHEYEFVTYYTVRLLTEEDDDEPEALTETDKFYDQFDDEQHEYFDEFEVILDVIDGIGHHKKGAEDSLFRFEDAAHALPPSPSQAKRVLEIEIVVHSTLRLYCIRLTNRVVILLNGGVKTVDEALECPNVKMHFKLAQQVAESIDSLLIERSIIIRGSQISGSQIINNEDEQQIILHFK
jgi:hypothetical protein